MSGGRAGPLYLPLPCPESEDEPPPPLPPPREPTPEPPPPPETTAWLPHDRSLDDRLPEATPVTATFDLYIDSVRFIPDNAVFCKVELQPFIATGYLQLGAVAVVRNMMPKGFCWYVLTYEGNCFLLSTWFLVYLNGRGYDIHHPPMAKMGLK